MAKLKLEYLWLDGYEPVANLRGKTKVVDGDPESFSLDDCEMWGFDGSSTLQADGGDSDCMLKPIAIYPDSTRLNGFLVMCEVMLPNGDPHPSNARATIPDDPGLWIGLEQEYFLMQDGIPLGWPSEGYPGPQGEYYCGVGYQNVGDIARTIVEEHLDICLDAGINHEGINAEVAKGQWEFQVFGKGSATACDQIWVARYILQRVCEKYGVSVEYHCKPFQGDWNGAGAHTNYSTESMRRDGGMVAIEAAIERLSKCHVEHITQYGSGNEDRLTGAHETCDIDTFRFGVADRGSSIRIPLPVQLAGKGYLEDRRPAANVDPYVVCRLLIKNTLL